MHQWGRGYHQWGGARDPPMGGGVAPLDFQGPLANSIHSTTIVKRMQSHKK